MNLNWHNDRVGDCFLAQPAIVAYAEQHQEAIHLYLNKLHEGLFENLDSILFGGYCGIHLVDTPHEKSDFNLVPYDAFLWSHEHNRHFSHGYFPQLGLAPPTNLNVRPDLAGAPFTCFNDPDLVRSGVFLAPFAASCLGLQGQRPNIMAPLDWWEPIIAVTSSLGHIVYSLGGPGDLPVPGTVPIRSLDFRQVVLLLATCKLLLSVETGILHFASAARCPTIFFSSATPITFASPVVDPSPLEIVRADYPENWSQADAIAKIKRFLGA